MKYTVQEIGFVKNILVLQMPVGQSHWKYSLKSGNEIIRRAAHRSKKRNIVDSWVLLVTGKKKKLGSAFATKQKHT